MKRIAFGSAVVSIGFLATSFAADARDVTPPDVVKLPAGLNLGDSSFYDGFGSTDSGWTLFNYARWNDFTSIKNGRGQNSPLLVDPHIDALSAVFQVVYNPLITMSDGAISFEAILPIADIQSHFNSSGVVLRNNGLGLGDLTLGAAYQAKPIPLWDQSVLSWRFDFDVTVPTGGFDSSKDINQSSGFWSLEPYLAITLLPVPKWEVSARFSYDYNFSTSRASNPPQIPGFAFRDGQAGQAAWINFAASYEVIDGIRPGLNGFWLRQLANDSTNSISVPGTRVEQLYLGPGVNWQVNKTSIANFNVYLPISAKNTPAGPQFNILFIHQL